MYTVAVSFSFALGFILFFIRQVVYCKIVQDSDMLLSVVVGKTPTFSEFLGFSNSQLFFYFTGLPFTFFFFQK